MSNREQLLNASIREFEDYKNRALLVPYERVVNKQGFTYLVLDYSKAKKIKCAIHFNREYVVTEEIGRLHTTTSIDFSTREKIDIPHYVVVYRGEDVRSTKDSQEAKDLFIFLKSFDGYNETMKQYMYSAEALTCDKNSMLHEIEGVYGHSCFDILQGLENYTILPFYGDVEPYVDEGCIIMKVTDQQTLSLPRKIDGVTKQLMVDSVQFTLLHYKRADVLKFIQALEDMSRDYKKFGFASTPKISEFDDLQEAAALRGLAIKIELDISYSLEVESEDTDKRIEKVYYVLEAVKI